MTGTETEPILKERTVVTGTVKILTSERIIRSLVVSFLWIGLDLRNAFGHNVYHCKYEATNGEHANVVR